MWHIIEAVEDSEPSSGYLVKQSCHDSGIDIRDPPVLSVPRKTVYSDADILLSESEFLPPVPVIPLSSDHLTDAVQLRKKKATSVSFSLEDSKEQDTAGATEVQKVDEQGEKQSQETKKNKVSTLQLHCFSLICFMITYCFSDVEKTFLSFILDGRIYGW